MSDEKTDITPRPSLRARTFRKVHGLVAHTLGWVVLTGGLLQITVTDTWPVAAPLFYMLPLNVVCLALVVIATYWVIQKEMGRAYRLVLLAIIALVLFSQTSWRPTADPFPPRVDRSRTPVRVLAWNLFHGRLGPDEVVEHVKEIGPDVAVFIESGELEGAVELWGRALPGSMVIPFGAELLIVSRGEVSDVRRHRLGERSRAGVCTVEVDDLTLQLVLVDLVSSPWASRGPAFAELTKLIEGLDPDVPIVVLGDFNTPRTSHHFAPWPERFTHAFDAAGHGFGRTWPALFPLWDLDHIWVDDRLHVQSCRTFWNLRSDHLPLLVTLLPPS